MDYEMFLEQMKEELQHRFPEMNVEIRTVDKLQGESYRGITITPEGSSAGATLNLQKYYRQLQDGRPMTEVIRDIRDLAEDAVRQIPQVDTRQLADYEQMKDTLIMQAVPTEQNKALLAAIPHREIEDISIVYRFRLDHGDRGDATILVTNQMLQRYGITAEQLMKDAEISAPRQNPVSIRSMAEVLSEMSGMPLDELEMGAPPLLVATVPGAVNGSGILGYPDFLKEAAEKAGGSFYVLPSSIHEVLLLRDDGSMSAGELNAMITSINASEVSPEDRLSDSAFHYDAQAQIFEKATAYEEHRLSES